MKRKGFTLIELLIVITIIGILAVALVPRISQGPARARDVSRKADLQNIVSALELYYSDTGTYPTSGDECMASGQTAFDAIESYLDGGVPAAPPGASGSATGYCDEMYYYDSDDGSGYTVAAAMETVSQDYYCDDLTSACDLSGDDEEDVFYVINR